MKDTPRAPQSPPAEQPPHVVTAGQIQNGKLLLESMDGARRIVALFAGAKTPEEQAVAHQAMVRALATWAASAPAPRDAELLALSHRSLDVIYAEVSGLKAMLAGKEPTDG